MNNITVCKADIASKLSILDIIIDVNGGNKFPVTIHFDITQGTKVVDTASHVKGVEDAGKG